MSGSAEHNEARIPLTIFALGTAIGQLPATLVHTNLGQGLGDLLDEEA